MKQKFSKHLKSLLSNTNSKLLVAVSGGVDSVVLSHLIHCCGFNFDIAHMNYRLRGADSDLDEAFVRKLAQKLSVRVHVNVSPIDSTASGIQEKARNLRYAWFAELKKNHQYDAVISAHHADDQIETLFMRLSRGSGVKGLGGIHAKKGFLIRPLLPFFKTELIAYAKENNLRWREDVSNESTKYFRNVIRHKVIPEFLALSTQTATNALNAMKYLQEATEAINVQVENIKSQWKFQGEVILIPLVTVQRLKPLEFWSHHLFSSYGFNVSEILKLLKTHSGKKCESATHQLMLERNHLVLAPISENEKFEEQYLVSKEGIDFPIRLHVTNGNIDERTHNVAFLDAEKLSFPLILKRCDPGDFFYPTGMKGKKKLSKFFKDEKMSALDKKNQWVLYNKNDVIWVVNRRVDRRYASNDDLNTLQIKCI